MRPSKFVESIIRQVNPMELPKEDGTAYVFLNSQENYVYVMNKIYAIAPRGYVDIEVVLCGLYNWKMSKANDTYIYWFKNKFVKRYHIIEYGEQKTKAFMRKFLISLHERTHTPFDLLAFDIAYKMHLEYINSNKLKVSENGQRNEK